MGKVADITGQRFGKLVAIEQLGISYGRMQWLCRCDCGKETRCNSNNLRTGGVVSCGCYKLEVQTKHGRSRTPEYRAWIDMIRRCTSSHCQVYKHYGARGIKVCKRWVDSFEAFFKDMGLRPKGMSIERINNSKGYTPSNCKWATKSEQNFNKRYLGRKRKHGI
jgi:hypothetical protein